MKFEITSYPNSYLKVNFEKNEKIILQLKKDEENNKTEREIIWSELKKVETRLDSLNKKPNVGQKMVAQLNQNPDIIPGILLTTSAFLSNPVAALVVTGLAGAAGAAGAGVAGTKKKKE